MRLGIIILFVLTLTSCYQSYPEKPNIIFILADDLGYGDVSCYNGDSKIITSNIDNLATQGIMFTDAHTSSSVCTPTRYGILTGRYNWRSTLKQSVLNGYSKALIPQERETIASFLKNSGYKTAGIGKWHLGWDWANIENGIEHIDYSKKIKNGPMNLGFDYFYGFSGSLDMPPYVWVENDKPTMIPTKETIDTGKQSWWRIGPTSDDFSHQQVLTDIQEKSVHFIKENASGVQPFFLYMPLPAPHTPILPTGDYVGKSGLDNPYGDFVLMVDGVVGEIMKTLEENGISKNTIVFFTSDNGCSPEADFEQLATRGHDPSYIFRGHKADIYEGGHRVPFIVSWKGKVSSGKSEQLVCTTDFFATVADVINKDIDDNTAEDSYSLLSSLGLKSDKAKREGIVHHSIDGSFAYRKENWKVCFSSGSGGWSDPKPNSKEAENLPMVQLYDLSNDIAEQNNMQADYPEIVGQYRHELTQIVTNGRSTPGILQKNDGPDFWNQLEWMSKRVKSGK